MEILDHYITKRGYKYSHFKVEDIEYLESLPLVELDHLEYLLEEAPNYENYLVLTLTQKHFIHLRDTLKISGYDSDIQTFMLGLAEGEFNVFLPESPLSPTSFYKILINPTTCKANKEFVKGVMKSATVFQRKGLQTLIDPNWGGKMDAERLKVVSLIISG